MNGFRHVRHLLSALAASVLMVGLLPGAVAEGVDPHRGVDAEACQDRVPGSNAFPDVVDLPDGWQPEGIAIRGTTAYLGSLADGDIYAADLVTGAGQVISQGPGTPSVGLAIDQRDRLWVAGGPAGEARVVDADRGELLATYELAQGQTFINDVVLTRDTAWFTDSFNPVLHGIPLAPDGSLADQDAVVTLSLGGDYVHQDGFNLNGIERTPDGRALLAVQSATGTLYRIDPTTGEATMVDLGGDTLAFGDGLLLHGRTLYAVQNQLNQVAVVELDRAGTSGTVVGTLTDPDLDIPTTVARHGSSLYLPNARFGTSPTPQTAYTVVRLDARGESGGS